MCVDAGSVHETPEGLPLDEQTELEVALFMSLQDQEHIHTQAAAAAESESETESAESESLTESSGFESESEAESAHSEPTSAAMAAAEQAFSAAAAAAFEAESAAFAAAAQGRSAAAAASAQAESAANAAVAQGESAASAATARATAAANSVAAQVEAAARSVDAALNHQAASVRGTVLSFADHLEGWWPRRPRPQQRGPQHRNPQPADGQQRGPQQRGPQQEGPEHTGAQQADVQQSGTQVGVQASHSTAPGQASVADIGPSALSTPSSHLVCQEEEEEQASLAEAVEPMQSPDPETDLRASRVHSVSSDDSSFDLTEAPAAAPAPPIRQFAALSLLDLDSTVPSFEDLDGAQDPDVDDSPFDVHSEEHGEAASSHISMSQTDVAMTDAGQVVPVIPWDATESDQDLRHNTPRAQDPYLQERSAPVGSQVLMQEQGLADANTNFSFTSMSDSSQPHTQQGVQDAGSDVPVSYPQIDASPFSASMRLESPVRYPQLHRPSYHHSPAGSSHSVHQPASPRLNCDELPSPRTQMHLTAMGSGAFSLQSSTNGDEAQHMPEHEAGNMSSAGGSGGGPLDSLTGGSAALPLEAEQAEEPVDAAASIHVHSGLLLAAVHTVVTP